MKTFFYQYRNENDEPANGYLQAASRRQAIELLQANRLHFYSLREVKQKKRCKLSLAALLLLCRQLAILLRANIDLQQALHVVTQGAPRQLRRFLQAVNISIASGNTLSNALENSRFRIPPILNSFIIIGETSGRLDLALEKAVHYLQYNQLAKERLKTVSFYPMILVSALLGSMVAIYLFILPAMNTLLQSLQLPLPWFTRLLLQSDLPLFVLGGSSIVSLLLAYLYLQHRCLFYRQLFRLPLLGCLFQEIFLLRFCSSFDALLGAGINLHDAINILRHHMDNVYLQQLLDCAAQTLAKGLPLSTAWQKERSLPPLFLQLVAAGETSGDLSYVFVTLIDFYKKDIELLQKRLFALLEPSMLIILAICIGSFVVAIALPLLDAVSYANVYN